MEGWIGVMTFPLVSLEDEPPSVFSKLPSLFSLGIKLAP